jgi:ferredoxin
MSRSLHIDWTKCDGRGLCTELLPGKLGRDDWGYPVARHGNRTDIPIGPDDAEAAQEAVRLCPKLALRLVDGSAGSGGRSAGC